MGTEVGVSRGKCGRRGKYDQNTLCETLKDLKCWGKIILLCVKEGGGWGRNGHTSALLVGM